MVTKKETNTTQKKKVRPGEGDQVLASYLDDIAASTPLAPVEEAELAARIRAGDEFARNELVEANLRFVVSVSMV